MITEFKLTKVQEAIKKEIEVFINRQDNMMECDRDSKYSACHGLMYCFHDKKSITVDGDLYSILFYGSADYSYGIELSNRIFEVVDQCGYYLENEGQGIYNIVKN